MFGARDGPCAKPGGLKETFPFTKLRNKLFFRSDFLKLSLSPLKIDARELEFN